MKTPSEEPQLDARLADVADKALQTGKFENLDSLSKEDCWALRKHFSKIDGGLGEEIKALEAKKPGGQISAQEMEQLEGLRFRRISLLMRLGELRNRLSILETGEPQRVNIHEALAEAILLEIKADELHESGEEQLGELDDLKGQAQEGVDRIGAIMKDLRKGWPKA